MERRGFSVTFERWDDESLEFGETDDRGFVVENVSLRDALAETGEYATEANEWPIHSPQWIEFQEWNEGTDDYFQGNRENRFLHIPEHVTDASRRRICRLLGLRV